MDKIYISPNDLLADAFDLSWQVFDSGFRPDYLLGVWRGGTPVAIAMQELLQLLGVETDHLAIRSASYTGIAQRQHTVAVDGLDYLQGKLFSNTRILLVDDVHDTGLSLQQVIADLDRLCPQGRPEIRIATPWFKPGNNQTARIPDYFVHESDAWLVFPHELEGLTWSEMLENKPELGGLLDRLSPYLNRS